MPDERLEVSITFDERHGYIGSAPELRSPVTALSLNGLRKQVERSAFSPRDEHRRGRGPHALCGDQRAVLSSNGTPQRAARCSACSRSPGR